MSTGIFKLIRTNQPEIASNICNYMIKKEITGANQPEKKDASGCAAQGVAMEPEAGRILSGKIQDVRKAVLGSLVSAAAALGFNKNTIDSYEREKTLPDIDFLVVFAAKTGADLNELVRLRLAASRYPEARALSGVALGGAKPGTEAAWQASTADDVFWLPIPRYEATGPDGKTADVPSEIARIALSRSWLESQGLKPIDLVYIRMPDDSMSPTIRPGALLVIDSSTDRLRGDGIYGLYINGHLAAKRLQLDFGGAGVWVRSDNPAYKDQNVPIDALDGRTALLGKIIWCAGPVQE